MEPTGMVLVLAADMVRRLHHASWVRRTRPQQKIQVYTRPRAWTFSTWAALAIMWHLATEGIPIGTAGEIARDLHILLVRQAFPWRRPKGGLPVAPAVQGLSLAATLQQLPDKMARPFLQTGRVLAAPPGSGWKWEAEEAQPLPDPWVPRFGPCQRLPWPMPPRPSTGLSHCPNHLTPCSAACRRERPGFD